MSIMMKCGHVANASHNGEPCCIICECFDIDDKKPDLTGRIAKCAECSHTTKSNYDLPFFQYNPDKNFDEYYCGCHGWN